MTDPLIETTEDAFLGGSLMLLAAATSARPGDRVVDFGAGVGAAGLAVARRVAGIRIALVEIDPVLAALARDNAASNAIEARVIAIDIAAGAEAFAAAGLSPDSADVVLMNPPFNDSRRHRPSPNKGREIAHVADAATLENWIGAARRILKSGGVLTLIWRADGLGEVLATLDRGFGSVAILPVHGNAAIPATRVLVRAIKGGRAPTALHPGLMLNDESGVPNKRVQEILAGRGNLPLAML
jgi:tRNA1(Val) A37 N6-methylase TrmN6